MSPPRPGRGPRVPGRRSPASAPRARPPAASGRPGAGRPRPGGGAADRVRPVRLPPSPAPTAQYVQAVRAGSLLFVAGHDPEAGGRLVYRGCIGADVSPAAASAAARLATLNALASAREALGSLRRVRRCLALTAFVVARPGSEDAALLAGALELLRETLGPADPPVVWFRPATGLAGGMPVEVELLLDVAPRR